MVSQSRFWGLAAILVLLGARGSAQEPRASQPTTTPDRYVFVPYEREAGPQWNESQSVLLPYAEFLRLKGAAEAQPGTDTFKPIVSLSQSSYIGTIDGGVARFDAEFTIEAVARPDDALEVQLPLQNAAVETAEVFGAGASLGPLETGVGLRVFLTGPGRRTARLRLATPIRTDGALKHMDFQVPRAAASSLRLKVPEEIVLEADAQSLPASILTTAEGSEIQASCGSRDRLLLVYRTRLEATGGAAQARISAEQTLRYAIAPQNFGLQAQIRIAVLAGSVDSVALRIPLNASLLNVAGPFVRDWTEPGADGLATVTLVRPLSEAFTLDLLAQADAGDAETPASLPEIGVSGAVRETGEVIVVPDPGMSIWAEEIAGLEPFSLSGRETAAARGYRFAQPGWRLSLTRRPTPARIRSEGILLYEAAEDFVRLKSRHNLAVSGRGIFAVAFEVPEGFELVEAGPAELVSGERQRGRLVEVNFRGEQLGPVVVDLRLRRAAGAEVASPEGRPFDVELAPIRVPDAEEDAGSVVLAAPGALRATELRSTGLETVDVRLLQPQLAPLLEQGLDPALGYRYFEPTFAGAAQLERQRTRLTCETWQLASITPSLMRVDATLNFNVEFSAADEFLFLVPASAGEDVRITGGDIKEKKRAASGATAGEDALATWTIRLQQKVIGAYPLGVSFDVPLAGAESGAPLEIAIPRVGAAGVARETGYIAISRGENLEVQVAQADAALERRDVKELPPALSGAFLGFRFYEPEKRGLSLKLIRHELEEVLGALIRRLHVETVLTDQREATHEAIFEIQNNREQYLELGVPSGMEIWSAFVRGRPTPVTTRQADGAKLIELTKSETLDTAFRVRLILRETLDGGDMGTRGRLVLAPIQPLNIPVLRTTWKLYLPDAYRYVDFGGSMQYETGGGKPWIEPAAEKLLNDWPAEWAGGIAQPALEPPVAQPAFAYDATETDAEKQERLRATTAALEIPIVRQGLHFEFSKLSGVGDIQLDYWKRKPLLLLQGGIGLALFALLLAAMRVGRRPWIALTATVIFFIAASLTDGFAGRMTATLFAASAAAAVLACLVYVARHNRAIHLGARVHEAAGDQSVAPPVATGEKGAAAPPASDTGWDEPRNEEEEDSADKKD